MSYSDKLLSEVHLRFRDLYKNVLKDTSSLFFNGPQQFNAFQREFTRILSSVRAEASHIEAPKPRSFQVCLNNSVEESCSTILDFRRVRSPRRPWRR